jgi:TonB family protein
VLHLDSIEVIDPIDEAVFTPPVSAVPQIRMITTKIPRSDNTQMASGPMASGPRRIIVAPHVMIGNLLKKVQPDYPPIAQAAHVAGTVVLQATIGKDGRIENLRVVSGPAMLQQASLDAVKKWVYKPYTLNGEPVEVETTINVIFGLTPTPNQMPAIPMMQQSPMMR